MSQEIVVDVRYSDTEIRKALKYTCKYIYHARIALWGLPLLTAVIAGYGALDGFSNNTMSLLAAAATLTIIHYLFYYRIPTERYVAFYRKRKGGTYTFSQNEIKIVGIEMQMVCAWSLYKKAMEIPNSFLLLDENKFIYVFQKNCFNTQEDIQNFRILLKESVSKFNVYS